MELADELEEDEETDGARDRLAPAAAPVRLAAGDGPEEQARLARGSRGDREPPRRPALAGAAEDAASARPGVAARTPTSGWPRSRRSNRLADESGDPHLRVAIRAAGAYAYLMRRRLRRLRARARRDRSS